MQPSNVEMIRVLAEKCMGWKWDESTCRWLAGTGAFIGQIRWNPRTSWADAGMLLDKMRADGWDLEILSHHHRQGNRVRVAISKITDMVVATGEPLTEAIALAAYRAVTEGQDGQ